MVENKKQKGFNHKWKSGVFEAIYTIIYEKKGNYILVSEDNTGKHTDIVTPEGKSILKKPIIEIIESKTIHSGLSAFHVLNTDFTESLFIYDQTNKNIVQWLYEDYYSLSILERQSE